MYQTDRLRGSCRCRCQLAGCVGCTYAVAWIVTEPRPSDAPVSHTSFTDDLPNTCAARCYFVGPASCAARLAELVTEFGSGCVSSTDATIPINCGSSDHLSFILSSFLNVFGGSYRLYQVCDDGTLLSCQLVQSGPIPPCNSTATITHYSSCCCVGGDGNYTVVTGTGVVCVHDNVAYSGTGLVSSDDYYSWSNAGADSVNIGTSVSGTTTRGVGFTVTIGSGGDHFERRNSQFPSYSGNFTPGEPLLYLAPASPPTSPAPTSYTMVVTFDVPVQWAGFRVQQAAATFRTDFFIHCGHAVTPGGSDDGLFIDATAPGANSAPFYGIAGSTSDMTFTTLTFGLPSDMASGPGIPFAISTLEVHRCQSIPLLGRAVPPDCIDREVQLPAALLAAAGHNPLLTWYGCRTGEHLGHSACGRTAELK